MEKQIKYEVGAESLQKVLEYCLETEFNYEQLKSQTSNESLIDWIEAKQELTTGFIMKILNLLNDMEIQPLWSRSMMGKLNTFFLGLKLMTLHIEDEIILRECAKIDNFMLNHLESQMNEGMITSQIYDLYQDHEDKIRKLVNFTETKQLIAS